MKLREFCRVHKRKVIVTAAALVLLLAVGTAGVVSYIHRKNAGGFPFGGEGFPFMGEDGRNTFQGMNQMFAEGAVSASGLTSAGMTLSRLQERSRKAAVRMPCRKDRPGMGHQRIRKIPQ